MRQHVIKMKSQLAACWVDIVVMLAAIQRRKKKKCKQFGTKSMLQIRWDMEEAKEVKWEKTEEGKRQERCQTESRGMQMKEGKMCYGLADTAL